MTVVTKELYEKMQAELSAAESTILGYFFGEKAKKKFDVTIYVEPQESWAATTSIVLFDDNMRPTPNLQQFAKNQYEVAVPVSASRKTGYVLDITPEKQPGGDSTGAAGFYYRVPGAAKFELKHVIQVTDKTQNPPVISNKMRTIGKSRLVIAQYGVARSLPSKFGAFKSEVSAFTLDPLTGGIRTLAVNGQGLSKEQAAAANEIITKSQADERLAELKREKEILQLQKDIEELRNGDD